jgi:hypothetical protein
MAMLNNQRVHHKMVISKGKLVKLTITITDYMNVVSDTHSFGWCHMPKQMVQNHFLGFLRLPAGWVCVKIGCILYTLQVTIDKPMFN